MMPLMTPVILSGGSGTRLWPVSTPTQPKQFQCLVSGNMMITETALRVSDQSMFTAPMVIGSKTHQKLLAEALDHLNPSYVLEPMGRNTAAAIAMAALIAAKQNPAAPLLILPSDHAIQDTEAFLRTVTLARPLVDAGRIVTFGIEPTEPHTGYGYIERGSALDNYAYANRITRFVEKPQREAAEEMLRQGNFYWNSGMFMATAGTLLHEFEIFAPEILSACMHTLAHSVTTHNTLDIDAESFANVPSQPFDIAVMEKTSSAVVLPAHFDWSDVGNWAALHQVMRQSKNDNQPPANVQNGNIQYGNDIQFDDDVRNSFVRNDTEMPVFLSGVSDVIVVVTKDGIVVTSQASAQEVRKAAERKR